MFPPRVVTLPLSVGINETVPLKDLFSVIVQDGDSIARYEIIDNGRGGGRFEVNGIAQDSGIPFTVQASQLNNVIYRGGDRFGSENYSVRAIDSTGVHTAPAFGTITSGKSRPVVTARDMRMRAGEHVRLDRLVSVSDADNDPIRQLGFVDRSGAPRSGQLYSNGVAQAQANWFFIDAADFSKVIYRASAAGPSTERIAVQVSDGFSFSELIEFRITTSAPAVVTSKNAEVLVRDRIAANALFNVTDADGDKISHYFIVDRSNDPNGGYFELNGVRQQSSRFFRVTEAQMPQLFYVGGASSPQSENVGVLAYDGVEFGAITDVAVKTVSAPVIVPVLSGGQVQSEQTVAATSIFAAFDVDGDAIKKYWIVDRSSNEDSGYFELNGVRLESARFFSISPAELGGLVYRGGTTGLQTENIGVQVFAGRHLSQITDVGITTLPNANAPMITLPDFSGRLGTVFNIADFYTYADVENDPLTRFGVFDTGPGLDTGYFSLNGVRQPDETWLTGDLNDLQNLQYHVGMTASTEEIRFYVEDAQNTSATVTANAEAFEVPNLNFASTSISIDTLENVPMSSLVTKLDGGPDYTMYQVFDEFVRIANGPVQPADRSSQLVLNGVKLQQGIVHTLTADQFEQLQVQGAEADFGRNLDPILVRATNGVSGYSEWERLNVNTDPVGTKSLEIQGEAGVLQATPLADAVGATDDGRLIFTYTFIDGGNQGGTGTVANPAQPPLPTYYMELGEDGDMVGPEAIGTLAFSQPQREAVRQAFNNIEIYANVQFVEQPYEFTAANSQFLFGAANLPDPVGAYAYLPSEEDNGLGSIFNDIWFNSDYYDPRTEVDTSLGSPFYATALHEIGHALGFDHPFEGDPVLSIFNNFEYNTVMAYEDDNVFNTLGRHPEGPSTMALYDIAQLQNIYGANTTYNLGDTNYTYAVSHQQTLWDAGGIDTLDFSAHTTDEQIDLRQGTFSTLYGIDLSLRIAYGAVVENARGGIGDDSIQGNEIMNMLYGGIGNDLIIGAGDNDHLFGQAGNDTYVWGLGDGHDTIHESGAGKDVLEIHDPSGALNLLQDDMVFSRLGDDLQIDLRFDMGESLGTVRVENFAAPAGKVETLRFFDGLGNQLGTDIDLISVFDASDEIAKSFKITANSSVNGSIAVPV